MSLPPRFLPHLSLLIANVLFGMNFSYFSTIIKNYMSYENLFFSRVLFSAMFFIPFAIFSRRYHVGLRGSWLIILATALIIYGNEFLMLWGVGYTTPFDASIIATMAPIVTLVLSHILLREKIHIVKIIGIALSFSGAMLLIFNSGIPKDRSHEFGNLLILLCVIAGASNTVIIKPALVAMGSVVVIGWCYVLGLITTAPFFLKDFLAIDYGSIPLQGYMEIGFVVIIGTIVPNLFLYFGTWKLTSVHTGLYSYLQPITATIFGLFRHQISFTNISIISSVLILLGVLMIIRVYKQYSFPVPDKIIDTFDKKAR